MNPMLTWEMASHRQREALQVSSPRRALHRRFFPRF